MDLSKISLEELKSNIADISDEINNPKTSPEEKQAFGKAMSIYQKELDSRSDKAKDKEKEVAPVEHDKATT